MVIHFFINIVIFFATLTKSTDKYASQEIPMKIWLFSVIFPQAISMTSFISDRCVCVLSSHSVVQFRSKNIFKKNV